MKKSLPGILLLIAMPCSVMAFIKVEALSGSDILGLLAALSVYAVVIAIVAFLFGHKNPSAR